MTRNVAWGGIHNARDLVGLTGPLGTIQAGRYFRMPRPDTLDAQGWTELEASGVRTLVDLRNADEIVPLELRPDTITSVVRSIEDQSDPHFMAEYGALLGSPKYYAENLRRWPEKIARAIRAIVDAAPGGVVVHCAAGRDRTGLITALVLEVCGVERIQILDDYEAGVRETNEFLRSNRESRELPREDEALAEAIHDARAILNSVLNDCSVTQYLSDAGFDVQQQSRLMRRLMEP